MSGKQNSQFEVYCSLLQPVVFYKFNEIESNFLALSQYT